MAVYQGARAPRAIVVPRGAQIPRVATHPAPALPRRRMRAAVRARRGTSRISILLAVIVVLFAGAFFSLSQDIRVSATGYEMDRLAAAYAPLRLHSAPLVHDLVQPRVRGYLRRPTLRWLDRIDIAH